jgi:hypothetical protein
VLSLRLIVICSLLVLPRFRTISGAVVVVFPAKSVADVLPPLKFRSISSGFEFPFLNFKTISGPDAGLVLGVFVVVVLGIVPTVEVIGAVVVLEPVVLDVAGVFAGAVLVVSVGFVPFPPVIVIVIAGPTLAAGSLAGCFWNELYNLA